MAEAEGVIGCVAGSEGVVGCVAGSEGVVGCIDSQGERQGGRLGGYLVRVRVKVVR